MTAPPTPQPYWLPESLMGPALSPASSHMTRRESESYRHFHSQFESPFIKIKYLSRSLNSIWHCFHKSPLPRVDLGWCSIAFEPRMSTQFSLQVPLSAQEGYKHKPLPWTVEGEIFKTDYEAGHTGTCYPQLLHGWRSGGRQLNDAVYQSQGIRGNIRKVDFLE